MVTATALSQTVGMAVTRKTCSCRILAMTQPLLPLPQFTVPQAVLRLAAPGPPGRHVPAVAGRSNSSTRLAQQDRYANVRIVIFDFSASRPGPFFHFFKSGLLLRLLQLV